MTTNNLVSDDYATRVCKIGQGHECCRYLTMGGAGFACAKLTALRHTLDARWGIDGSSRRYCDWLPLEAII